jgi:predicted transcriptional regulator
LVAGRTLKGNVKIMFSLPPALVKALKRVATERKQTNSTVVEEWIARGVAEHDARKVEK